MDSLTIEKAAEIWAYMAAAASREKSDAIVVCCSYDLRVCDHACELLTSGYSDTLVLSGNTGNWTRHIWSRPEAQVFYERALSNGVSAAQILIESEATNFGENITYAKALIPWAETVTFVSKPNSLLRVKLTAEVQWPEITAYVSGPEIRFPDEVSNIIGVLGLINEMVGDIERLQKYPDLGFQAPHLIPDNIVDAWKYLVEQGFTDHLMPDSQFQADPATVVPLI